MKLTRRLGLLAMPWLAATAVLAVAALGVPAAATAAVAGPAAAAAAERPAAVTGPTGQYTPSTDEWWLADWQVHQKVWPLTEGKGVTVGVVDTGVQAGVPDLRGVVVPGGDMLGDPGDGETDFDTQADGHGTAVAVLIAGQGYGTGTIGIAPQATILPVHAATPGEAGDPETLAAGIEFAASHGAQIINVSLGLPFPTAASCDPVLQDAVAYALAQDVVVVAASGDTDVDGTGPVEPASCAGVLAVGAVGPSGQLWPDSTRQPYVAVTAPGDHIDYVGRDGRYTTAAAGTSASAALAAGTAALIRSRYPSMPWWQVDQRLIGTAVPEGPAVPNDGYGYGIIDPARAVNAAAYPVSALAPDPPQAMFTAWLASLDGQAWAQANDARTVPVPTAAVSTPPSPAHVIESRAQAGTVEPASSTTEPGPVAAPRRAALAALTSVDMPTNLLPLVILAVLGVLAVTLAALLGARSRRRSRRARLN
jgi:membrane-anchored mycosin MYCP